MDTIKQIINKFDIISKKSLGQNYILDQNITQYTISMFSPAGVVDIAQGFVDNNTSTFSQQMLPESSY